MSKDVINEQNHTEEYHSTLSKIVHEVRNPVTLINSSLQIIEKEHPEVADFSMWKETISDMHFLRQLLDDLSSFNNSFQCNKEPVSMSPWLTLLIQDIERTNCPKNISFNYKIGKSLPILMIDSSKLSQAFSNLLMNAFEAAEKAVTFCACLDKTFIEIQIHNDGAWIPFDKRSHIFRPFETTKPAQTGLGLTIAKDILDAHHAALTFISTEESGTTFRISFPIEVL